MARTPVLRRRLFYHFMEDFFPRTAKDTSINVTEEVPFAVQNVSELYHEDIRFAGLVPDNSIDKL